MLNHRLRAANKQTQPFSLIDDQLLSYWTMDNFSGYTLLDEMGNYNGSVSSGYLTNGVIGYALSFNGYYDFVNFGKIRAINKTSLTFTFWLRLDNNWFSRDHPVLSRLKNTSKGFAIWLDNVNYYDFSNRDALTFAARLGKEKHKITSTSYILTPRTWVHFAVMFEKQTRLAIYKNGQLNAFKATNLNGIYQTNKNVLMADADYGIRNADISLDDFRIYTRALSDEEINRIYNGTG